MSWPAWLISALRFVLAIFVGGDKSAGKEIGKAQANVENFETQADRVAAANKARADARADTDAGWVPDVDPYRRD